MQRCKENDVCIASRSTNYRWMINGGKRRHIGYMKGKFQSKKDCCAYYDRHNPHMRSLNALGNYESDWDPNTRLIYIVCRDRNMVEDILPFADND